MAKPATRQGLIDYCLRKLGAPVLEINVDDDQIDDLVDDAIQLFNERHFDGVERMYLKYKITQDDINRGEAKDTTGVGIVTTTATSTNISGYGTTTSSWYETSNFIQVPDSVVGVEKIFSTPGIGPYFVDAAFNRDYFLVMGIVILYSVFLLLMKVCL